MLIFFLVSMLSLGIAYYKIRSTPYAKLILLSIILTFIGYCVTFYFIFFNE